MQTALLNRRPMYPWEFVQIGSCGSPIELDDCWLLLTHGVGPVRKYSIGAVLLDKKDPSKVLARRAELRTLTNYRVLILLACRPTASAIDLLG
jgi:predicted GH43/DUF377 family glycosyl hydrolase